MIEPLTATPSDMPICRLVEAIAAATPACSRGMPEVAAFVIGAFTSPNPTPMRAYAPSRCGVDVPGPIGTSSAAPAAVASPETTSGNRAPVDATSRPDSGAHTAARTAIGNVRTPAASGASPNSSCR